MARLRRPPSLSSHPLQILASRAGHDWVEACTRALRSQRRAITGAWPGTLTEARARVLDALRPDQGAVSIEELRVLARAANHAARDAWREIAVADEEP